MFFLVKLETPGAHKVPESEGLKARELLMFLRGHRGRTSGSAQLSALPSCPERTPTCRLLCCVGRGLDSSDVLHPVLSLSSRASASLDIPSFLRNATKQNNDTFTTKVYVTFFFLNLRCQEVLCSSFACYTLALDILPLPLPWTAEIPLSVCLLLV